MGEAAGWDGVMRSFIGLGPNLCGILLRGEKMIVTAVAHRKAT